MNDDKKPPIPLENNYDKHYSDASFWDKIKSFAAKAGYELIRNALLLYYAMQSPTMPAKDKAIIVAVLGYFILPTDFIVLIQSKSYCLERFFSKSSTLFLLHPVKNNINIIGITYKILLSNLKLNIVSPTFYLIIV